MHIREHFAVNVNREKRSRKSNFSSTADDSVLTTLAKTKGEIIMIDGVWVCPAALLRLLLELNRRWLSCFPVYSNEPYSGLASTPRELSLLVVCII